VVPPGGEALQVDPMELTLKAPGSRRLKLKYDASLSNFAFEFNLRRYSVGAGAAGMEPCQHHHRPQVAGTRVQ